MREYRVWAPKARAIEVEIDGSRMAMTRGEGGWWSAAGPAGTYGFAIDGGEALPDPRSAWQPDGVNALSRVVDHAAFFWTDSAWQARPLSSAIVYELHVGAFTLKGTFEAAIERLAYLVSLGVTHVELMPVNEFPGEWGWGYDGADLFAPHHAYGGPEGLKRFVDACHASGLAVLIDVVYNHLGPTGNYLDRFGPYFTDLYSTPWGRAVNFDDRGSAEVRRFFCDNALQWLRDYHADGLRIDAVHAIFDASAMHFLEQLAREVAELSAHLGRALVLIAESDLNDPRVIGGFGMDAQWSDDFHHALHAVLTGERNGYYSDFGSMAQIAKALTNGFVYDGEFSEFRGRVHGRKPVGLAGWNFLGYMQTHDQVGNRARGERAACLMSEGRLKMGAALVMCSPFVPMIFAGEELGARTPFLYFTDHHDEGVAKAVTEGRRREFQAFGWKAEEIPDPQDEATFLRSKLDWDSMNERVLDWYRRLIALRKRRAELTDGRMDLVRVEFSDEWIVVRRGGVVVVCNLGEAREFELPFTALSAMGSSEDYRVDGARAAVGRDGVVIATDGASR
jgi:maltooligosyltrehalose trehalohydrolase